MNRASRRADLATFKREAAVLNAADHIPGHIERAIERASEDDRHWFNAHQKRRWRLRNARRFEFPGDDGGPVPEGKTMRVIVALVGPGVRVRWPCLMLESTPNSCEHDELPEAMIENLFEQNAPLETQREMQRAAKGFRRRIA
jgi:hypothetical protein